MEWLTVEGEVWARRWARMGARRGVEGMGMLRREGSCSSDMLGGWSVK